ncbi:hypothetical protein EON81_20605 [bacterium]|nr:MAG: hypothetical protein EON81_20605 [bacterium]
MIRNPRTAALTLTSLIVAPVLATAAVQRMSVIDGKTTAAITKLARKSRNLSSEKKEALTTASASATFAPVKNNAASIFTNTATDKASVYGYFTASKLAEVKLGLPFLNDALLGKDLRFIASLYEDTKIEELALDAAKKVESGKYDQEEVGKTVETMTSLLSDAYTKRNETSAFNFRAGTSVGYATVLGYLYIARPASEFKTIQDIMKKVQEGAKDVAKSPSGELPEAPKKAFVAFTEASMIDAESTSESIDGVNKAYIALLD